jgi:exonuclease III
VYAVNGTDKPYFDHDRGTFVGDRHAFKRLFQARLQDYFAAHGERGGQLVLLGDWNVSRTPLDTYPRLRREPPHALARAQFNDGLMPGLDLVDVFRERHPALRKYTWFNRRARAGRLDAARVDFSLISRSLLPRVVAASIEDQPTLRFGSDHAPIRLTLEV